MAKDCRSYSGQEGTPPRRARMPCPQHIYGMACWARGFRDYATSNWTRASKVQARKPKPTACTLNQPTSQKLYSAPVRKGGHVQTGAESGSDGAQRQPGCVQSDDKGSWRRTRQEDIQRDCCHLTMLKTPNRHHRADKCSGHATSSTLGPSGVQCSLARLLDCRRPGPVYTSTGGVCGVVRLSPPARLRWLRWLRGSGDDPVG